MLNLFIHKNHSQTLLDATMAEKQRKKEQQAQGEDAV